MPEEARLLSENGLGYIVDDHKSHQQGLQAMTLDQKDNFKRALAREGREASKAAENKKIENTERAMRKLRLGSTPDRKTTDSPKERGKTTAEDLDSDTLFSTSSSLDKASAPTSESQPCSYTNEIWAITPAKAYPPLPLPCEDASQPLPSVKASSYALFKHLHAHEYYMSPGLRFGCQFLAYPGDPLRFHSHFLAVGFDWDEDINLLDLVGGGRLGTGVKKGWLIGGLEEKQHTHTTEYSHGISSTTEWASKDRASVRRDFGDGCNPSHEGASATRVRTFCIEWGGM
ncbi:tRNA-splicing endonuclease subunit [Lambiella insularis]|nr:tRNA-splicing endonuclease subunit [Lambiella insularis]